MRKLIICCIVVLSISGCVYSDKKQSVKEYSWEKDSKGNRFLNAASYNRCILIDTSITGKQIFISSHSDDLSSDGFLIVSEIENGTPTVVRKLDVFSRKAKLKVINHRYFLILQDLKHLEEDYYKYYNTIIEYNEDWEFVRQAHIYLPNSMKLIDDIIISDHHQMALSATNGYQAKGNGTYLLSYNSENQIKHSLFVPNTSLRLLQYTNETLYFTAYKRYEDSRYHDFDSVSHCSFDEVGVFESRFDTVVNAERFRCNTGEVLRVLPPIDGFSAIEYINSARNETWIDTLPDYSMVLKVLPLDSGQFLYYIHYEPRPFSLGILTSIEMVSPDGNTIRIKNIEWRWSNIQNDFRFFDRDAIFWQKQDNDKVILIYEKPLAGRGFPLFFDILNL